MKVFVLVLVSSMGIGTFYGIWENGQQAEQRAKRQVELEAEQRANKHLTEREAKHQAEREADLQAERIRQNEQQAKQADKHARDQKADQLNKQRALELVNAKIEVANMISTIYEIIAIATATNPSMAIQNQNEDAANRCVDDFNKKGSTATIHDCKEMLRWGNEFLVMLRNQAEESARQMERTVKMQESIKRAILLAPNTDKTLRIRRHYLTWLEITSGLNYPVATRFYEEVIIREGNDLIKQLRDQ